MKRERNFFKKHKKFITDLLSILFIILAFMALLSYYYDIYTKLVDICIILIVILLSIDCLYYYKKLRKNRRDYIFLAILFFIVAIAHLMRFIFGPLHCKLFPVIISIYLYELCAFTTGILLFYLSLYLIKNKSGIKYHHVAGILVGCSMITNHLFKIILGKCV